MYKKALLLLASCGVFQIGMGMYFIALRPTMLAEDEKFTGLTLDALRRSYASMPLWLDRVFIVLGGHAVASGLLIVLATILLWNRTLSITALILITAAGSTSVLLMSTINFAIHSDFRWLLLLPTLAWTGAVLLLANDWRNGRGVQIT